MESYLGQAKLKANIYFLLSLEHFVYIMEMMVYSYSIQFWFEWYDHISLLTEFAYLFQVYGEERK